MKKAIIIIVSVVVILAALVAVGVATGALNVTSNPDGTNGVQTYTEEVE